MKAFLQTKYTVIGRAKAESLRRGIHKKYPSTRKVGVVQIAFQGGKKWNVYVIGKKITKPVSFFYLPK